jgi:FSR family fosmidomycin resistance protein-like MFS transporter
MVAIAFGVSAPLLIAFVCAQQFVLAVALIMLFALFMNSAYSSLIVLGQSYLPNRLGLASGISLGVVVSVGGITSPLIGLAGDHWGISVSMIILAVASVLAFLAAILVVRHHDKNTIGGTPLKNASATNGATPEDIDPERN